MPQTTSLVELSLADAVEALAKRAADLRSGGGEKLAGVSDVLTSVGQQVKENPYLRHSLLGAGLGAGVGGLSTLMGNRGKEEKDRQGVVSSMLTGGLAGGAIGGGASLAHNMLSNSGSGQGLQTGDALKPGMFKDPSTGKTMQIDPEVLRKNPELAAKVREMSNPGNPIQKGIASGVGQAWNLAKRVATIPTLGLSRALWHGNDDGSIITDDYAPISSQVLPAVGGVDLALNSKLNLGERIGVGRVRPQMTNDPQTLMKGMSEQGEHSPIDKRMKDHIATNTGGAADKTLANLNTPLGGGKVSRFFNRLIGRRGPGDAVIASLRGNINAPSTPTLNRSQVMGLNRDGYRALEGAIDNKVPRSLFRGPGMKDVPVGKGIWAARAAAYLGLPLMEYALRSNRADSRNENSLQSLIKSHAKEVK